MTQPLFIDASGPLPAREAPWEPIVITKEQIDAEIERLATIARPANGRRRP